LAASKSDDGGLAIFLEAGRSLISDASGSAGLGSGL